MAPGKLDVFGLGSLGVNVDKNAINLEDGELTKAQNATHDPVGSMGGVRKRPGLTKVNSGAVSGSVFGVINVPIAPVTLRTFLVGIDQSVTAAYQWVTSITGFSTTATATTPSAISNPADELFGSPSFAALLSSKGTQTPTFLVYAAPFTRGAACPIRIWDGTVNRELFRIPSINVDGVTATAAQIAASQGAIRQMLIAWPKMYLVVHDFHNTAATFDNISRVLEYDFDTGALQQIGQAASGYISTDIGDGGVGFLTCAIHGGYLYAGLGSIDGANSTDAGIYRIRPGLDTTWTIDYTGSTNETPLCMAVYKGLLYAGFTELDASAAPLKVRAQDGSWSNSTTIGAGAHSMWASMCVFGDNLYATSRDMQVSPNHVGRIHKFDGSSWSIVKTLETSNDPIVGVAMLVHNDILYVLCKKEAKAGQVSSSVDGTTWIDQTSNLTTAVACVFGVLTD